MYIQYDTEQNTYVSYKRTVEGTTIYARAKSFVWTLQHNKACVEVAYIIILLFNILIPRISLDILRVGQ